MVPLARGGKWHIPSPFSLSTRTSNIKTAKHVGHSSSPASNNTVIQITLMSTSESTSNSTSQWTLWPINMAITNSNTLTYTFNQSHMHTHMLLKNFQNTQSLQSIAWHTKSLFIMHVSRVHDLVSILWFFDPAFCPIKSVCWSLTLLLFLTSLCLMFWICLPFFFKNKAHTCNCICLTPYCKGYCIGISQNIDNCWIYVSLQYNFITVHDCFLMIQ